MCRSLNVRDLFQRQFLSPRESTGTRMYIDLRIRFTEVKLRRNSLGQRCRTESEETGLVNSPEKFLYKEMRQES